MTGYIWNPEETVLSTTEKNGELVVRAQDGGEDNLANMAGMMTYYGYDVPDTFTIINEYILDAKTCEIKCSNVYANFGEEDILLIENKRVENPEVYKVDPRVTNAVNAEDHRTVTVIADPGTEQETVYTQTIAKGCRINIGFSAEHSSLFTDEACTQEFAGGADLNEDLTLYTIHN